MAETIRIYDEKPYETEFRATVLSVSADGSFARLVLNQTLFFPEEGGQSCDRGTLAGFPVTDVQIRDGVITHTVSLEEGTVPDTDGRPSDRLPSVQDDPTGRLPSAQGETLVRLPSVQDTVSGRIDWQHRFSNMQNHTGEHILSGILFRMYGYENVGFHLSDRQVTFDTSGPLTADQIADLEYRANEVVWNNLPVTAEYPDPAALQTAVYRSKGEVSGRVRLVTIEDLDVCACCAPHVRRTGEVGLIKILKAENYKGGIRFTILCGLRAYREMEARQHRLEELSHLLLAKQETLYEAVERVMEENRELKDARIRDQEARIRTIAHDAENRMTQADTLWLFEAGLDPVPQRNLVNLLFEKTGKTAGVFVGSDADGYRYVIGSGQDARWYSERLKVSLDARGGGSPQMVQGTVRASAENIREVLKEH